ncbi:MAG: hypothetical protein J6U54_23535 [Clostridiales bacterium]|nr:hypothetical protein [Clostridiales bacterium]
MEDQILVHHGTDGMRWGKRKYQYEDGSLTPLGRIHYGVGEARDKSKIKMREDKARAKAEAKVIKARSKAEIQKIRAESKAYKEKLRAEQDLERQKVKNDSDVERERLRLDREAERNTHKENMDRNENDYKIQKEVVEAQAKADARSARLKFLGGALAAAGIGFLAYKGIKSGFLGDKVESGKDKIKDLLGKKASEVADSAKDAANETVKNTVESKTGKGKNKDKGKGKDKGNKDSEEPKTDSNDENGKGGGVRATPWETRKKFDINAFNNKSGTYTKVKVNEDGSTTETKSMFKSKFGGQKRLDQAYANAVSDNDKAKSGNAKTKYIINPQGDYYKVTKNSNGTTTETKSIPKSAKNLKNSIAFKKKYSQIYNTNYNKRQEIKDWYKKNAKHSEDHEGMILIHSQANVELYHWGILGMKWGVRRWQNPDGTLTEAGKAHYGKMSGESASKEASNAASAKATAKSTPAISAVSGIAEGAAKTVTNTVAGEATKRVLAGTVDGFVKGSVIGALAGLTVAGLYQLGKHISQKRKEKAEKILEENKEKEAEKFLKEEEYINKNSKNSQEAREAIENENLDLIDESAYFKDKKRADAAAKLGIKALIKNKEDYGGDLDPEDKDTREWFIEEDQTIGLGTIADLVNQGKSKQYIVKTIENLEKADYDFDDRKAPEGSFALSWSGYEKNNSVDKFIDACIEIREEEKRTH